MVLTDEQGWIEAARNGQAEAWEFLVQTHQEPVFRLAYLLLGDSDDAEDVAQETFVRAYHSLAQFDVTRPLRPWLMRITTNLCHNWRRSAGRYFAALQNAFRNEPPGSSIALQADQQMDTENLWNAVRRLRMEDQQIIYLRYFLDTSEAETAEVLGIAPGTVKSRHHRALARLRTVLQKEYPHLMHEQLDAY